MKYPYDIVSFVRQKTLSIEAHFTQVKQESPMKVFDDTFSRFVFTVIADGKTPYCNVPIEALPAMRARTDIAAGEQYKPRAVIPSSGNVAVDTTSIAFTRKFFAGTLKGKSPAEVLIENPEDGKNQLNSQYSWLKENLEKYPKNAELMEAIKEASKLDLSALNGSDVTTASSGVIDILDIGCRPLIRKTRSDGKCFVYECKITWDTARKYNVTCEIKNYYANVIQNDSGTLNVNLSTKDKDTEVVKEFNMTADEWLYALHEMESARDCFKMLHFNEGYNLAEAAAQEARMAAKAS